MHVWTISMAFVYERLPAIVPILTCPQCSQLCNFGEVRCAARPSKVKVIIPARIAGLHAPLIRG
jgi:hypothetical protein